MKLSPKSIRKFGDSIASIFYKNEQDFAMVIRTSKKGNIQNQITQLAAQISKDYGLPIQVIANPSDCQSP